MSPKNKIIIFSIISLLIFLVFLVFLIYPQLKGIKKSSQDLINNKKELISFKKRADELEEFKKTYQELEPNLKKIDSLFVDPAVPINLIKFWESTARESGLSIDISPTLINPPEFDPWGSMSFQIILIGNFSNFLRFLEKIENAPYLIETQNLVVKEQTEKGESEVRAVLLTKVFTK